jgi:hypothetical protein
VNPSEPVKRLTVGENSVSLFVVEEANERLILTCVSVVDKQHYQVEFGFCGASAELHLKTSVGNFNEDVARRFIDWFTCEELTPPQ